MVFEARIGAPVSGSHSRRYGTLAAAQDSADGAPRDAGLGTQPVLPPPLLAARSTEALTQTAAELETLLAGAIRRQQLLTYRTARPGFPVAIAVPQGEPPPEHHRRHSLLLLVTCSAIWPNFGSAGWPLGFWVSVR